MWNIKNEILQTAKGLNLNISEVSTTKTKALINSIIKRYTNFEKKDCIWEGFTEEFSIKNKDAWKWIDQILSNQKI